METNHSMETLDANRRVWWRWFTVALVLLLPVDLVLTIGAVAIHGMAVEANPVMRWLFEHGLWRVLFVHLLAGGAVLVMFQGAVTAIHWSPPASQRVLERGVTYWVSILLAGGLVATANNLLVVLWGESLISLMHFVATTL